MELDISPVAQVVAQFLFKYDLALVIGVEVHVEGINNSIIFLVDYDTTRFGSLCLSLVVGQNTLQPCWIFADVVLRGQIDDLLLWISLVFVQNVEVVQCQLWKSRNRFVVHFGLGMSYLSR